jgi:transcriptional regulator with XRE-family HTH domain
MIINIKSTSDYEALLGEQIKRLRIARDIDQISLASQANISVGAIKNLEGGKGSSLKTLILVLRALNQENWLTMLGPATTVSPLQMLRDQKLNAPRQRASRKGPYV